MRNLFFIVPLMTGFNFILSGEPGHLSSVSGGERKSHYPLLPFQSVAPVRGPHTGHGTPGSGKGYEIWTSNCHTAANAFCLQAPHRRGVLVCGGKPERQDNPSDHTASWEVLEGRTCIFNWGANCCWQASEMPPDISQSNGQACAKWACGNQYGNTTRVLPTGKLVEIPGFEACVTQVGLKGRISDCKRCCDERTHMWDPKQWGTMEQHRFHLACKQMCDSVIGGESINIGCNIPLGGLCGNSGGKYSPPNCCERGRCVPKPGSRLLECQKG